MDTTHSRFSTLMTLDRQLVSGGIRLIIILPIVSLILLMGAIIWTGPSPNWWQDSVEPTIGFAFSSTLTILALSVCVGNLGCLVLHRMIVSSSVSRFDARVEQAAEEHSPVDSLHGFSALNRFVHTSLSRHSMAAMLCLASLIGLSVALFSGVSKGHGFGLLVISTGLVLLSLSQHLLGRFRRFDMTKHYGLLDAHRPAIHPSSMDLVFNDMISTFMDPFLRVKFSQYLNELDSQIKEGVNRAFAREKIMFSINRMRSGMSIDIVRKELLEILTPTGVDLVFEHEIFDVELWNRLFDRVESGCPAFFRLLNRLEQDLAMSNPPAHDDLVFDVDLENIVIDEASLFCFMHNLGDQERVVSLRVQSPDLRPKDLVMTYRLRPGENNWWPNEELPLSAEGDDDVVGRMAGLLKDGTLAWQTLLPERSGDATISVRLENPDGDLIIGRQINVRVKSELRKLMLNVSSRMTLGFGVISIISGLLFMFRHLLKNV